MISEKTFIRYYSSFWEQLLPGVDHYVRMINSGLKERLYNPIETVDVPARRALINGIAYHLFYKINKGDLSLEKLKKYSCNSSEIEEIQSNEAKKMASLNSSETFGDNISINELSIIKDLVQRLVDYSSGKPDIVVYPKFQGCGLLFDCYGDILYRTILVEVKGGKSNFTRQDLLQMLTYGALNYISDTPIVIDKFELLNIRTGLNWYEEVEEVCEVIAGASSAEVYSEIVNYISNNYRSI